MSSYNPFSFSLAGPVYEQTSNFDYNINKGYQVEMLPNESVIGYNLDKQYDTNNEDGGSLIKEEPEFYLAHPKAVHEKKNYAPTYQSLPGLGLYIPNISLSKSDELSSLIKSELKVNRKELSDLIKKELSEKLVQSNV